MKKQNNYKNIDVEFQLLKLLNDPLSVKVRSSSLHVSARKVQLLKKYFRSNASTSLFLEQNFCSYTRLQKENELLKNELKLAKENQENGEWAIKKIKKIVQVILDK